MKKIVITVFTLALCSISNAFAQEPTPSAQVEAMFRSLKSGDTDPAIDTFTKNSLIPSGLLGSWKSQARSVITLDPERAILGFELVDEQNISDSVKRLSYVLKLADRPLFWSFTFYKPSDGWIPLRLSFVEEP